MENKDIIKALKCCVDDTDDICQQCPLLDECKTGKEIKKYALDLIVELQEENEKLKAGAKRVEQEFRYWQEAKKELEELKGQLK